MKNLQAVNLKERKEGCVRGFGGSKNKGEMIYHCYNLQDKRISTCISV